MSQQRLKILLVEDQLSIAQNIIDFLEEQGHLVDYARNGKQGLDLALEQYFDLVILDLMLPLMDGLQVCAQLREKADRHIPILMLTARDTLQDKVKGFETGADDYLTKPFALEELLVRCMALARRHQLQSRHTIEVGELVIDRRSHQVERAGKSLVLKQIPYQILLTLAESFPTVVSRSQLIQTVWGDDFNDSDSLRSHIYQLRQQLDKPFAFPMLKTVHGVGFCLSDKA